MALVDHISGKDIAVLPRRAFERGICDGEFANFHDSFRFRRA
jgi:hypothetical protein